MKTKILALGAAALTVAGLGAGLASGTAHAAPSSVTAVTHIFGDPDSGNGGTWATDAFDRTVHVSVAADQTGLPSGDVRYTASVSDSGTFVTHAGADTPNQVIAGQKIAHDVDGTFSGSADYVITAPSPADVLTDGNFPADLNAGNTALSGPQSTSLWPEQAFSHTAGVTVTLGNWSWTYATPAGESWTDSSTNGDGNVIADGNITGLRAKPAAPPVLSRGHALSLGTAREDVFFTLSGTPAWVHFQIFGPGAINGHQGWVPAADGVNKAVYGGLEAGHTYLVYYTPVEGQGSSVQIPGTRISHVTFVTASH